MTLVQSLSPAVVADMVGAPPNPSAHLCSDGRVRNGTYTLVSDVTGEHRTLRLSTVQRGALAGRRILALLVGPDNQADYQGFAFVADDNTLRVWGRFQATMTQRVGTALMAVLVGGSADAHGAIRAPGMNACAMLEGTCCVCNRPLTCPESIRNGIGPVCAGRGGAS